MTTEPVYLTEASLRLDGKDRLKEAASNPYYIVKDFVPEGGWQDEVRHNISVTPIHEAGHAVAMTLAGHDVRDVVFIPWGGRSYLGRVNVVGKQKSDMREYLERKGVHGLAREVVCCFAGPVAEIRFDPSKVFTGAQKDFQDAENACKFAEFEGVGDRFEWHQTAWAETCRMFSDDGVWAAVEEIGDRLRESRAVTPKLSGGRIRSVLARHMKGRKWDWSGVFERRLPATTPSGEPA